MTHQVGADRAAPIAVAAGGAAHGEEIRTQRGAVRQVVGPQRAGERDECPRGVGASDGAGERGVVDPRPQAATVL
ncbi:MAG: hypothetical protein WD009_11245, partial [Phycisphaeraceae bacterium]